MSEGLVKTTVDITGTMKQVGEAQLVVARAQKQIQDAFEHVMYEMETLENDEFWAGIEVLNANIKLSGYRQGTQSFIHNLAYGHVKELKQPGTVSVLIAMRFLKTYGHKKDSLYNKLFDVIEGYGDDGYGDIIDSFPLFGRTRYNMAMEGEIEGDSEAQYQGENYMRMTMEDALVEKFAVHCMQEYTDGWR